MRVNLILPPVSGITAASATNVEGLGFDGLFLSDTQCLAPDVWGQLLLAAGATRRIELGPGVTNPVTRDVAIAASSALAVQHASGGRAVFAVGRGDSAVKMAGRKPPSASEFERFLIELQGYLRLEEVDRGKIRSRIRWPKMFDMNLAKVPVEVAATGPKVIQAAARHADRITLAVGADADYVSTKLEFARQAADEAGREEEIEFGAYVNAVVHPELDVAQEAVRGSASVFAHFASFGPPDPDMPEIMREAARFLGANYRLDDHASAGVPHADGLSDDFVDWYGIAGPPERARTRFEQLADLGLDYLTVVIGYSGIPLEVGAEAMKLLATEIVPGLQSRGEQGSQMP